MDPGIVPLAILSEYKHFFGDMVGVDHIEVDNCILLKETGPCGAPVVVGGNGDQLLYWNPQLMHSTKTQDVQLEVSGLSKKLHFQNIELR